jgi:hypothetical protein
MAGRIYSARGPCRRACALASVAIALAISLPARRVLADDAGALASPSLTARARKARTLTFGFFNDILSLPSSDLRDDDGFTGGVRIAVEDPDGGRGLRRVGLAMQIVTERGGLERVDDARLYASWQRFLGGSPADGLTLGWMFGVRAVGDLGGSSVQDWSHRTIFSGRHLDGPVVNRLQDHYATGHDVLGEVGGLVKMVHPLVGPGSLRVGVEGGLGLGTGYFGELHPFAAIAFATGRVDVEFRLAAGIYGTNVRPLTMPGGYDTGFLESQPSLHVSMLGPRWFPTTLSFDLEWNQGNSGQQVGGLTLGTRF